MFVPEPKQPSPSHTDINLSAAISQLLPETQKENGGSTQQDVHKVHIPSGVLEGGATLIFSVG